MHHAAKIQQLNHITERSWGYLRGGLYFSCCKAGFSQRHFKGNKGSCKPCKPTTGTPHPTMTWPYSVIGAGGCTDPRWVASFTKVSFVNQSATGDEPFKLHQCLWRVPETQDRTRSDSHHQKGWITHDMSQQTLRYQNLCDVCDQYLKAPATSAHLASLPAH